MASTALSSTHGSITWASNSCESHRDLPGRTDSRKDGWAPYVASCSITSSCLESAICCAWSASTSPITTRTDLTCRSIATRPSRAPSNRRAVARSSRFRASAASTTATRGRRERVASVFRHHRHRPSAMRRITTYTVTMMVRFPDHRLVARIQTPPASESSSVARVKLPCGAPIDRDARVGHTPPRTIAVAVPAPNPQRSDRVRPAEDRSGQRRTSRRTDNTLGAVEPKLSDGVRVGLASIERVNVEDFAPVERQQAAVPCSRIRAAARRRELTRARDRDAAPYASRAGFGWQVAGAAVVECRGVRSSQERNSSFDGWAGAEGKTAEHSRRNFATAQHRDLAPHARIVALVVYQTLAARGDAPARACFIRQRTCGAVVEHRRLPHPHRYRLPQAQRPPGCPRCLRSGRNQTRLAWIARWPWSYRRTLRC